MPCASLQQVLPARDTAGFRQEFIALTFLGSLGWIFLFKPFLPVATSTNRRFFRALPCRPFVRSSPLSTKIPSNRLGTKSSRWSSVKIPGEMSWSTLPLERALLGPHWSFFLRRLGGDLASGQQMKVIFFARKSVRLDFVSFLRKLDVTTGRFIINISHRRSRI